MKAIALVLLFTFAACTRCVAGTTGILNGYVLDPHGQPIADVPVTVVSPSDTRTTYTDKHGFFVFLTLPPDVYSVQMQDASGFNAYGNGVRISSDQTTSLNYRFSAYRHCYGSIPVTLASDKRSEQFESLDVRLMQTYPPRTAPPILLPMAPRNRRFMCL